MAKLEAVLPVAAVRRLQEHRSRVLVPDLRRRSRARSR